MSYKVSLYKPVEVEYGDQRFTLRKLNRTMFRKLADFEKAERAAQTAFEKVEVLYDELRAFIDAPAEEIDDLAPEQVQELILIVNQVIFKKQGEPEAEEGQEKNVSRPGEEPVVS
jgi:xylose isomerase